MTLNENLNDSTNDYNALTDRMQMKYAGSSTTAARINATYMLSLKPVELILIP